MKVFISWSGDISKSVAELIQQNLKVIIQSTEVFFSSEDIEKGSNWDSVLREELSQSSYGIVCLTPQNVDAPWINFEAGAIAKTLDSRVATLMVGVSPSEISGPLTRYQATSTSKNDFFKLIQGINNATEQPLEESILERAFEASWPTIQSGFKAAETAASLSRSSIFEDDEEPNPQELILQTVREIASVISSPEKILPPSYIESSFIRPINRRYRDYDSSFHRPDSLATDFSLLRLLINVVTPVLQEINDSTLHGDQLVISKGTLLDSIHQIMDFLSTLEASSLPTELRRSSSTLIKECQIALAKYELINGRFN